MHSGWKAILAARKTVAQADRGYGWQTSAPAKSVSRVELKKAVGRTMHRRSARAGAWPPVLFPGKAVGFALAVLMLGSVTVHAQSLSAWTPETIRFDAPADALGLAQWSRIGRPAGTRTGPARVRLTPARSDRASSQFGYVPVLYWKTLGMLVNFSVTNADVLRFGTGRDADADGGSGRWMGMHVFGNAGGQSVAAWRGRVGVSARLPMGRVNAASRWGHIAMLARWPSLVRMQKIAEHASGGLTADRSLPAASAMSLTLYRSGSGVPRQAPSRLFALK